MSADEAAIYLRKSRKAFYEFAKRHQLPHAHAGRRPLYLKTDLDKAIGCVRGRTR